MRIFVARSMEERWAFILRYCHISVPAFFRHCNVAATIVAKAPRGGRDARLLNTTKLKYSGNIPAKGIAHHRPYVIGAAIAGRGVPRNRRMRFEPKLGAPPGPVLPRKVLNE